MGAIKKLLIGILILVLGHSIYFYGFRNINNPRFDIFYQSKPFPETHFSYFYFLGEIPQYYKEFDERIVSENNQCRLINILRKKHPNYHNYIVLTDGESKEYLLKNSDSIYYRSQEFRNLISSQIDLEVFNMYLKCMNISNRDEIIKSFFYLSSTIGGDISYKVDYDPLPTYIPIKNIINYDSIEIGIDSSLLKSLDKSSHFNPKEFKFDEKRIYCWFKNSGIFIFEFDIEDGRVNKVTDSFLGYTGAEKW